MPIGSVPCHMVGDPGWTPLFVGARPPPRKEAPARVVHTTCGFMFPGRSPDVHSSCPRAAARMGVTRGRESHAHSEEERMIRTLAYFLAIVASFAAQPLAQGSQSAGASNAAVAPSAPVNLNTASLVELQRLPGIGVRTAERIVEFRDEKGPFKKIEELMNVQGIGEKSFLRLRSQITVTPGDGARAVR